LAGVLLGPSVIGLVDPTLPSLHLLAEIGVVLLLFGIGLETDLKRLLKVGGAAIAVAVVGVVLPFALGYLVSRGLGLALLPSVVAGAALTATSVGITARVFSDLGQLQSVEGQIVLGAAVIDDVIGLIILAIVSDLVTGTAPSVLGVVRTTAVAFGFLAGASSSVASRCPGCSASSRARARKYGGEHGARTRVPARGAGLRWGPRSSSARSRRGWSWRQRSTPVIERGIVRLANVFVPIFFVAVGAAVDVRTFRISRKSCSSDRPYRRGNPRQVRRGIRARLDAGAQDAHRRRHGSRGEVGLIFAQTGLTAAVIDAGEYSALMLMVLVTTFMAPPLLRRLLTKTTMSAPAAASDSSAVIEMTTEA
jgi:Kef-type K+ transport system membrane component KefB